jgi:hypothetical protein
MQHRLQLALRGPEWAFALPKDDFGVLEEIAARCCDFWNGANSLLIAVDEEGRLPEALDVFLGARDVEHVLVHETLDEDRQQGLIERFGPSRLGPLWPGFDENEVHPLNLQPSRLDPPSGGPQVALPVPVFEDGDLRRIALLSWGQIAEENQTEYAEAFLIERHEEEAAHFALVDGQVSGLAPLAQSTRLMVGYTQSSPVHARQLVVLDGTFERLVFFWNLRARASTLGRAAVVGIPDTALSVPERLRSLLDWTTNSVEAIKPDLVVHAHAAVRDSAANALQALGFREADAAARLTVYWGEVPEERHQPEYAFGGGYVGGRMRRGVWTDQMVTLEPGRNLTRFEPSAEFKVREWSGFVRLDLLNWPLPFPPTAAIATRVQQEARVYEGAITLTTIAAPKYTFDFVLPGSDELLVDFLAERGMRCSLSPAGRYAQALIGRLGGPTRLEALAKQDALTVLQPLTPLSRLKLVQRLERRLKEVYGDATPSEEQFFETVRDLLIAFEPRPRTLADLASDTGAEPDRILAVLETLIDTGFVIRGRSERCSNCGFVAFYSLGELDERLTCRACQQEFLLTVKRGPTEPRLAYQLDSLMERAMDQDLMPVLLTLRFLYSPEGAAAGAFWPGLDIVDAAKGIAQDCDILLAQDGRVTVCECKKSAPGLTTAQAEKTLALAEALNADTVFAALEGEFSNEVQELVTPPTVRLVTRGQLLPS